MQIMMYIRDKKQPPLNFKLYNKGSGGFSDVCFSSKGE